MKGDIMENKLRITKSDLRLGKVNSILKTSTNSYRLDNYSVGKHPFMNAAIILAYDTENRTCHVGKSLRSLNKFN
jgi:hypothetical protein